MKKGIAIFLIVLGLLAVTLSVREYRGKNKNFDVLGYELKLRNKKAKKIFYRNAGAGTLMVVAGVGILVFGIRKSR